MKVLGKTGALFAVLFLLCAPEGFAWQWPDTGQAKCYDNEVEIACPASGEAFYGQDAQYQGPTRSYTKLALNGVALPDAATQGDGWLMTRDNVTGLVWEMKTSDGSIHDRTRKFTWCDTNPATNGGNQGTCGTATGAAATDTQAFIRALNDAQFGGYSDWRLPSIKELLSLVDLGAMFPSIDDAWFPNTVSSSDARYWSSTTSAKYASDVWLVYFTEGSGSYFFKSDKYYVRAVRVGQ